MHPLRQYREITKLSQAELGALVGVTKAQISRIETGESHPSRQLATKLEAATRIPAAKLFFGEAA